MSLGLEGLLRLRVDNVYKPFEIRARCQSWKIRSRGMYQVELRIILKGPLKSQGGQTSVVVNGYPQNRSDNIPLSNCLPW